MKCLLGIRKWRSTLRNKSEFRNEILSTRQQVNSVKRSESAEKAAIQFIQSDLFTSSSHIACYLALSDEFTCDSIIKAILESNKLCYVPILSEGRLVFAHYQRDMSLVKNGFNVQEPEHPNLFETEKLDLVLVPFVGIDKRGNRVGRGAGYYDKTFQFKLQNKEKQPFLLAIGYDFQQTSSFSVNEWDVPMDGLLTEKRLILFK